MELRRVFEDEQDLVVVYVLASSQVNAKTLRFIDEGGMRRHVRFVVDPGSRAIDALGLRLEDPEPMEEGVPHPTTVLLDREGRVRLVDVREDFHIWLAPEVLKDALATIP